nr:GntR family transcriptional regulator [Hungatella hathewayi]
MYDRIYEILKNRIVSRLLPGGSSLPSRAKLCVEFGTSEKTVRRALAMLEKEGLIETTQRKRPTVSFMQNTGHRTTVLALEKIDKDITSDVLKAGVLLCYPVIKKGIALCSQEDLQIPRRIVDHMDSGNAEEFWRLSKLFYRFFVARNENSLILQAVDSLGLSDLSPLRDDIQIRTRYYEQVQEFMRTLETGGVPEHVHFDDMSDIYGMTEGNTPAFQAAPDSAVIHGKKQLEKLLEDSEVRYSAVYMDIIGLIAAGSYQREDKLPTHAELQKIYGVSVDTTTRAIQILREWGVVKTVRGVGIFVTADTADIQKIHVPSHLIACHVRRYLDTLEFLELTIEGAAACAAARVTKPELLAVNEKMERFWNEEYLYGRTPAILLDFITEHIGIEALSTIYELLQRNFRIGRSIPGLLTTEKTPVNCDIHEQCIAVIDALLAGSHEQFTEKTVQLFGNIYCLVKEECRRLGYFEPAVEVYDGTALWKYTEPQKDKMTHNKIIESGCELYRIMENYGFEAGNGKEDGRDTGLYNELKKALKCPDNKGLISYLKETQITAYDFLSAFLQISEPFAAMYKNVYETMEKYQVYQSDQAIKIRLSDDDKVLKELNLSCFEEHLKVYKKVRIDNQVNYWKYSDYKKLLNFFEIFEDSIHSDESMDSCDRYDYPNILSPVDMDNKEFYDILEYIYQLLIHTEEVIQNYKDDQTLSNDTFISIPFIYNFFPFLVCRYNCLVGQIEKKGLADHCKVNDAIKLFHSVKDHIDSSTEESEKIIKILERLLNLPFWEKRWYLYEIRVTCMTIQAIERYSPQLNINKDHVLQMNCSKASVVAKFKTEGGEDFAIVAQIGTPAKVNPNRKSIRPDIRIAKEDYKEGENTRLIVECKQRINMEKEVLENNIRIYEDESEKSIQNIFVNYDAFPQLSNEPSKTALFSEFRPGKSGIIDTFKTLVTETLYRQKIKPVSKYDLVLFDVSESMEGMYSYSDVVNQILALQEQNPDLDGMLFNENLVSQIDMKKVTEEWLESNISGGTNINAVLGSLSEKYPKYAKLLILSDIEKSMINHEYLKKYNITICLPDYIIV